MSSENFREFDFVIFGASGCVGHSVIEEIVNCVEAAEIKFAVAGRNIKNLTEALITVQDYSGNTTEGVRAGASNVNPVCVKAWSENLKWNFRSSDNIAG
ncbi:hypothetical protein TNCV_4657061 [Trichonephila clavipes]|nr:hypothetical protein TNCV_4657061 [Trichonephila clavipes]